MCNFTVVVIGFAEALAAPEAVWSLVDAGFSVIAFTRRGRRSVLRLSRHVTVHEITAPEKSVDAAATELAALLAQIAQTHGEHHVFLPLDDASLWLGSRMRLPGGWIFAGAKPDQAELALDKWKQIQAARIAGFSVPDTSLAESVGDLERYSKCLPIILRPAQAVSEQGSRLTKGSNWICANETELENAAKAWQERGSLLVQPYLYGEGEGVFGFATSEGVVAWSAHRRLRMMNPHGSGSSACISQPVSQEVKGPAERLVTHAGWRGLFMIELLRTSDGSRSFVEFNGRTWGSMALARRQGLEYPAWAVQLALDPGFSPMLPERASEEIECRNLGRELMHLLFVLRGPKSRALERWPRFLPSFLHVLRWRRGTTFYNWRRDDRKVFWADVVDTLRDQILKRKS